MITKSNKKYMRHLTKRNITELWEVEAILYLILYTQLKDPFWAKVVLVWGLFNLVIALVAQLSFRIKFKNEDK